MLQHLTNLGAINTQVLLGISKCMLQHVASRRHTHTTRQRTSRKGERAQTTICKLTQTQSVAHTQLTNEKQTKLSSRPLANH